MEQRPGREQKALQSKKPNRKEVLIGSDIMNKIEKAALEKRGTIYMDPIKASELPWDTMGVL